MWEIIKRKIDRIYGDFFFMMLFWAALVVALHFVYKVIHADRTPQGYYLSSYATDAGIAYRIKVSIDYMEDPTGFTTPDYKIALKTLQELNR